MIVSTAGVPLDVRCSITRSYRLRIVVLRVSASTPLTITTRVTVLLAVLRVSASTPLTIITRVTVLLANAMWRWKERLILPLCFVPYQGVFISEAHAYIAFSTLQIHSSISVSYLSRFAVQSLCVVHVL